jgi:hypothetical protein
VAEEAVKVKVEAATLAAVQVQVLRPQESPGRQAGIPVHLPLSPYQAKEQPARRPLPD